MKIKLILLILSLLTPILSYSQNTYPKIVSDSTVEITNEQLKSVNKLFTEGKFYKDKCSELNTQIEGYKSIISNYEKIDSARVSDLESLNSDLNDCNKKSTSLKNSNKILTLSTIGLALTSLLLLLFK